MKAKTFALLPFTVLALSAGISACSHQDAAPESTNENPQVAITAQQKLDVTKISDFVALNPETVLVSSETQGIYAVGGESPKLLTAGQYENLKALGDHHIAAVDAKANALTIFTVDHNTLTQVSQVDQLNFKLDGLCFYQSLQEDNLYAYLLDGDGRVAQYLLAQNRDQFLAKPMLVKDFFVGPENNACLANNQTSTVYFNETTTGLWAYPASPESSLERKLVRAIAPHGELPADFGEMVWVNQTQNLMAGISEDTNQLAVVPLDQTTTVENLTVAAPNAELVRLKTAGPHLLALDASDDQLLTLDMPAELTEHVAEGRIPTVKASVQTEAVDAYGDAADDPAIWHNAKNPSQSRVLGTNKKLGLMIYDMHGKEIQRIENGHVNNVDVRYGYTLNGKTVDIAAASNRSNNAISIYSIDPVSGNVAWAFDIPTQMHDIYGLCMQQQGETFSVWANDKDGTFAQYVLDNDTAKLARTFKLPSQPEGCVADDANNVLYAGEEDAGVWRLDLSRADSQPEMIIPVSDLIVADIEGLAIAHARNKKERGLLVISSQGDHSYVLAEMTAPYAIVGKFRVTLNPEGEIDGTAETDGIEVSTKNFGPGFEGGMMVIQDGYNLMPVAPQNFKYVSWDVITETVLDADRGR